MPDMKFVLNGEPMTATYEEGMTFLEVLRDVCGITSPKDGCAPQGYCGCCTVLIDGRAALSCLRKPETVAEKAVTTLEGVSAETRDLLAKAFVREGGLQCGFCTPGIVVRAASMLEHGKAGTRDEIEKSLSGHLCRCTGFTRIVDAIQTAGEVWETGEWPNGDGPRNPWFFGEQFGLERTTKAKPGGIGSSSPRYQGKEHALGDKPYVADMSVPGMLHGAIVLSEHARARFLAMDESATAAADGVVRILTAADVPGARSVGLIRPDWPVFVTVGETTRCVGDVLALVLADTQYHARRAAETLGAGVEYEVLEPVTDPVAALEPDAPHVHEGGNLLDTCAFSRGDVDAALASAAHVVQET
ncbi:MAG: 2Fe-2S iron-sulfur cluster-binding protein, partial [Gemmatimonadota bacterium]